MSQIKVKKADGQYSVVACDDQITLDITGEYWGGNYEHTGIISVEQFYKLQPFRDRIKIYDNEYMIYHIDTAAYNNYGNTAISKTLYYGSHLDSTDSLSNITIALRIKDWTIWDSADVGGGGSN